MSFSFGSSSGNYTFGQQQQQQPQQQLSFGSINATTTTSSGFPFGSGGAPATTMAFGNTPNTGFTFGNVKLPAGNVTSSTGFGFPVSSQGFGDVSATQASTNITSPSGNLFGTTNAFGGQPTSGFVFGGTSTPATSGTSILPPTSFGSGFGQSSAPSATIPQSLPSFSTTGFGFGLTSGTSVPSNTSAPAISSFGFSTAPSMSSNTSVAPNVSTFGFGNVSAPTTSQTFGLNFAPNTQAIAAPTTTTTTESGFSFGAIPNIASNTGSSIIAPLSTTQPFAFSSLNAPAVTTSSTLPFGMLTPTTNTTAVTTASLLGFSQSSAFAVGGNTTTATTTTSSIMFKPMQTPTTSSTTGFQLGGNTLAPTTSAPPVISTTTFSGFGMPKLTGTTTSAPSVSTSGFTFGAITSSTPSTSTSGFAFGNLGKTTTTSGIFGTTTTTVAATSGTAPALTAPALSVTTSTVTLTTTISTTTSSLFPVVGGSALTSALPGLTTTTTTITTAPSSVAAMNFRQLEESINKWTLELEEQEKIYLNQATQVNAWDRLLIRNGEKITQLNDALEKVKMDQQRLDHEIDFILAQQRELEELLIPLETSLEQAPSATVQQHADLEREHTYHLAENIDVQLKRMAEDLKEIIDHVNASNNTQDNTDPIYQVGKILNAHLDSLQWIDQNTALVQRKLDEVSQLYEVRRKDQERRFRLAYD